MPRIENVSVDLAGATLPDARTGAPVPLGDLPGVHVLTAIRHRY